MCVCQEIDIVSKTVQCSCILPPTTTDARTTISPSTDSDGSGIFIPSGFLPFGPVYGDSSVPRLDDGSTEEIRLGTDVVIFGSRQTSLYVS